MSSSNFSWLERKTCWISTEPQGSPGWNDLRKGRLTMSNISKYVRRSKYSEDPRELISRLVGLAPGIADNEDMARGRRLEPAVRDVYSRKIGLPIQEIGLAVWKEDPRFGASIDGEILETRNGQLRISDHGVEFKCPRQMYRPLVERIEALKKGILYPTDNVNHLAIDHYDQMMGTGVITGKTCMHYVVAVEGKNGAEGSMYSEALAVNENHWRQALYGPAVQIYDLSIQPMMDRHGVRRLDPPGIIGNSKSGIESLLQK